MTTRLLAIWSLTFLGLLSAGCFKSADNVGSDKVDESVVHQSWHLSYNDGPGAHTVVFARFRVGGSGGTNLILTPPSRATAAGRELDPQDGYFLDTLPGRHYGCNLDGFQQQVEVKYHTRGGQIYANTLRLKRSDFEPDQLATWRRGLNVTVPFVGPPLADGEAITLRVSADQIRPNSKGQPAMIRESKEGAKAVTVKASDLAPLANGSGSAQFIRTTSKPLQNGTPTGGTQVTTYMSKPLPLKLTD